MNKKDKIQNERRTPIEKHDTAAWANIDEEKPVSKVSIPSNFDVDNAKDYVDSNQK
ncbi:CDIF630_02480 family spore surface protein [Clostridium felsineum]|uniref:Uncharacterized protein n=1 Tax=Clostridium felsineum TaxID=36839 RepID=A0A1S8LFF8_9CLOT|nr:DUF3787 domain-containing protein [Clostridium felsineum]URZ04371.1 hypothetical protein CLAUR_044600 [Clostridium felsineum]URZ07412.1 hypothetical protein CLROS_027500 [Clostridium felsineum]URZ12443.1 hypothetical protein CROST_031650 [Clostridium felsineum]URZ17106.1 hypothetical protein CLFE_031580 [Clostridium felsineum DSM 794]